MLFLLFQLPGEFLLPFLMVILVWHYSNSELVLRLTEYSKQVVFNIGVLKESVQIQVVFHSAKAFTLENNSRSKVSVMTLASRIQQLNQAKKSTSFYLFFAESFYNVFYSSLELLVRTILDTVLCSEAIFVGIITLHNNQYRILFFWKSERKEIWMQKYLDNQYPSFRYFWFLRKGLKDM